MSELLNISETAQELRVSIPTIRSWLFQKRLPFVKLGRRVLVKREDLEAFVNNNVVEAKNQG